MKEKSIKLKWAKSEKENIFNFGDDLGPYIINKLSGFSIDYIHFANTRFKITKQFFRGILHGKLSPSFIFNYIKAFFISSYIISTGSILQWYSSPRCIVWGSGIMNRTDEIKQSNFLAVRGEYTKALISKLGFNEPKVIGDPALLLPIIYSPVGFKKYKLGIIPHQIHYDSLKKYLFSDDILIIKLNTPNIEQVIDEINSCEYTISTSLHGLIVSHAYNVKSLWYKYNEFPLEGDDVKFLDYFSSVKIPEYDAFTLSLNSNTDCQKIIDTIIGHDKINTIKVDIRIIQKQLIDVAPFSVKQEFYLL